jgi:hypothetical protein
MWAEVRLVFLGVAIFMVVIAVLQWRKNERIEVAEAVSPLDRGLKRAMPVAVLVMAAVAGYLAWTS